MRMKPKLSFPMRNERYGVLIQGGNGICGSMEYPVVVEHLNGSKDKASYDAVRMENDGHLCTARIRARNGNVYLLEDRWCATDGAVELQRAFSCVAAKDGAELRLFSDLDCDAQAANSFAEYQFVIPGALYCHNDSDGDGKDDYLGTYAQDYRDDRNPGLSVTCFVPAGKAFVSMLRTSLPKRDDTLSREQIRQRHFVHETDVGSLGIAPSAKHAAHVSLHMDYPFYERASYCLSIDGSEWAAYRAMKPGDRFEVSYAWLFGEAETLTDASWQTTTHQMRTILNDEVPLPFTLEEACRCRREMVFNSYREFPDKKGEPAGYFIHFSPRSKYGKHNILEYGFCGAQTLNAFVMLSAYQENGNPGYRRRALKTLDFFVEHCIHPSGLPQGIYDVDCEDFIYWWTGVLFPFQYAKNREELEAYLGDQVVAALSVVADELKSPRAITAVPWWKPCIICC